MSHDISMMSHYAPHKHYLVPEAPTDVSAQQVEFSMLNLSWTLPTVTNGIITDHAVSGRG